MRSIGHKVVAVVLVVQLELCLGCDLTYATSEEDALGATISETPDPFKPHSKDQKSYEVAIQGFCPVALRDQKKWIVGSRSIQALYGTNIYRFTSARAQNIFAASPEVYIPVLGGDCLVTYAEHKKRLSGKLEFSLIHKGRIYFFADVDKLRRFEEHPGEYDNADLAERGLCLVSLVDDGKHISGIPETVLTVNGLRYFFASDFHRRKFLSNPNRYLQSDTDDAAIAGRPALSFSKSSEMQSQRFGADPRSAKSAAVSALLNNKEKNGRTSSDEATEERSESRGMSGYCPVTIKQQGIWQRGKSKFKATYDNKIYMMSGPDELAAFRENPLEFIPVLGGDSVVSYVSTGERMAGSVFHATQYQNRLYLMRDAAERQTFRENMAQYENADLAMNGNCIVSQVDDKKEILGIIEYETVYNGLRYRFVSSAYFKTFLSDPAKYTSK